MNFKIAEVAKAKLIEIYLYGFSNFGENAADKYHAELHNIFELLCANPEMGRRFHTFRRHEHKNHIIFYETFDSGIIITNLYHKSEDIIMKIFSPE